MLFTTHGFIFQNRVSENTLGAVMASDDEKASKLDVFFIALFGYVAASAVEAYYRTRYTSFKGEFFSGESMVIFGVLGGLIYGALFLALPIVVSLKLNGKLQGTRRAIGTRAFVLGVVGGLLLEGVVGTQEGLSFIAFLLRYGMVFATAIFIFARRPDGSWVFPPRS